jgi:prephenate dehydratase
MRYPRATLVPARTNEDIVDLVNRREVQAGVIPIDNSLEGPVTQVLDTLTDADVKFFGECILPIEHCLIVPPGVDSKKIDIIYSHPQSLAQCRRNLAKRYPDAKTETSTSNSAAVEKVLTLHRQENGLLKRIWRYPNKPSVAAAVGPEFAANMYGGVVVDREVADSKLNQTRFVFISKTRHAGRTGRDKTTVVFGVRHDVPGSLLAALRCFYRPRNKIKLNITWLQPRPIKHRIGVYYFFLTCEGHRSDPDVELALTDLQELSYYYREFGSYPNEDSEEEFDDSLDEELLEGTDLHEP